MFTPDPKISAVALAFLLDAGASLAAGPNLGQPVELPEIAAWDISVHPDGRGLPAGSGTPSEGAAIYAAKCAQCHGADGKGTPVTPTPLVGGAPFTDISASQKTIANFWPYATTLFDYTRRAMPWQQPRSLTDNEVYALTAYLLAANKLIGQDDRMDADTLPKVRMPNRDGFVPRFPNLMPKSP